MSLKPRSQRHVLYTTHSSLHTFKNLRCIPDAINKGKNSAEPGQGNIWAISRFVWSEKRMISYQRALLSPGHLAMIFYETSANRNLILYSVYKTEGNKIGMSSKCTQLKNTWWAGGEDVLHWRCGQEVHLSSGHWTGRALKPQLGSPAHFLPISALVFMYLCICMLTWCFIREAWRMWWYSNSFASFLQFLL